MISRAHIPPMRQVPPNATDEERLELYRERLRELVRFNPTHFLPPGMRKRWWHFLKIEYPKELLEEQRP